MEASFPGSQALAPSPCLVYSTHVTVAWETVSAQLPRRTGVSRFSPTGNLAFQGGGAQGPPGGGIRGQINQTHLEMRLLGLGLQRGFLTFWLGEQGSC